MGKIFYIIGKSSSGKDTIMAEVLKNPDLKLKELVQYTTRPIRANETDGAEYHFIDDAKEREFSKAGKIIEERVYQTMHGPWRYMLVDDGQADLEKGNYVTSGTVESYSKTRDYYGEEKVVPIYIYVETGERLQRALDRERNNDVPKYAELCRRFLADEADFSDEKLEEAGILKNGRYLNGVENIDLAESIGEVSEIIRMNQ